MSKKPVIQKLTASFLLVLFLFGNLDKSHFHDLLADHIDRASCDEEHQSAVLHVQSVNCHFDDLVVSQPFVLTVSPEFTSQSGYFEAQSEFYYQPYFYSFIQHRDSRGPPSVTIA